MERYESLGLVGEGSYGTVLKCRHRESGRLVAIKKFMDSDNDKAVKKIALREIKLLRQLRHDNLVNLLEVWKRRRRWYLVFEFVERTLLDDLEQNTNGLDLNTSRQYSYQILRATAFCHQQNVIHRDIKPENILISHGGVVKLCDFGFARTMATPAEGGVYTEYVATRWYRAPELLVGDTKYGKPVDVWALGCLFMEMLTGQPLFPGDSDLDQIYHIVGFFGNLTTHHQTLFYRNPVFSGVKLPESFSKVSLEQRYPAVPSMVLELTQGCLQMDPERRAECSKLLEYPLLIHDSFHIRFVDELNAKIQKEHRENSTLPKIAKTPIQGVDEEDKRSWKGKDRTMADDIKEKMKLEEKMEKAKEKQSKMSKTMRNSSEPSVCKKPSKGSKSTDSIGKMSVKNKATKYTEQSKPPKVFQFSLKEGLKPQVNDTSSKTEKSADHRDGKIEAKECSDGSISKENTMEVNPGGSKNTQSSQHQPSYHTSDTNVPNILKMVTEDKSNWTSFSSPEHAANVNQPTIFCPSAEEIRRFDGTKDKIFTSFTKQSKNTLQSQTNPKTTDEMMAADCTKQFSPKPVMKNLVAQVSNKTGSTPLSFLTDHSPTQLSKVSIEVPKKGNQKFEIDTKDFTPKISKVVGEWRDGSVKPWSSQLVPNSSKDMILKTGPKADTTSKRPLESHKKDISMSKNRTLHSTDPRPSAFEETPAKKKTTASDPESIISESQVTVQGTNNSEPFLWHLKSSGALKSHTRSTVVFIPSCFADSEAENNPGLRKTLDSISFNSDLRPLTGIICSKMDNITLCEGDIWKNCTFSPPPPPAPPSGTPLLVPPSSALIMPPMSGVTYQNQASSRHLHLSSRHPSWTVNNRRQGGISSRQSLSSHLSGSNPAQLKERSVTCERLSPSDVCGPNEPKINCDVEFPDVKVLPDVQGRDGKHSRSVRKDHQPLEPAQGPVPGVSPQSSV